MYSIVLGSIVLLLLLVAAFAVGSTDKSGRRKEIYEKLGDCRRLMRGNLSARKDCLITVDSLLGKSLGFAGVKGSTVGERLKNAKSLFDRDLYEELWRGHKLRNRVVHENEEVGGREIKSTVKYFTMAIKKLLR